MLMFRSCVRLLPLDWKCRLVHRSEAHVDVIVRPGGWRGSPGSEAVKGSQAFCWIRSQKKQEKDSAHLLLLSMLEEEAHASHGVRSWGLLSEAVRNINIPVTYVWNTDCHHMTRLMKLFMLCFLCVKRASVSLQKQKGRTDGGGESQLK